MSAEIPILLRDPSLVVCVKPVGLLSQDSGKEKGLPALLREQLGISYVGTVHRLDRETGGVMVCSLDQKSAGRLSSLLCDKERTVKEYLALLNGVPEAPEGVLRDYLYHDAAKNKTYPVRTMRKGVKEASLSYSVLTAREGKALVLVRLHTGRTHQIRVQFASRRLPLCGDARYGGGGGRLALWSHRLAFSHPLSGKPLDFSVGPPEDSPIGAFMRRTDSTD